MIGLIGDFLFVGGILGGYLLFAAIIFDILLWKQRGALVSFFWGLVWPLSFLWYGAKTLDTWGKEKSAEEDEERDATESFS